MCKAVSELYALVDGRGMLSDRETSIGSRASIVSGSGGWTSGDSRGNVKLCTCLVWWLRCVVRAECAVINLMQKSVSFMLQRTAGEEGISTLKHTLRYQPANQGLAGHRSPSKTRHR